MEVYFIVAVVCAVIGLMIDGGRGLLLGALLGIFGLLISAILKNGENDG